MTETPTPTPRAPRWMRVTLIASLAANLLVVGLVAGAALNMRRGGFTPPERIDGPNPMLRALTREDARALRGKLREAGPSLAETRAESRRTFEAILATLRAEPFDADRLTAEMTALAALNTRRLDDAQTALAGYLAGLDPAARRAFADRLEDALRRGPEGRDGPPPRNRDTHRPEGAWN